MSVRTRAIDLLYAMCDHSNAQAIVEELMQYLERADYSIRETLVRSSSSHTQLLKVLKRINLLFKKWNVYFHFVWQHVIMDTRFCFTLTERNKIVIPLLLIIIHIFLVTHSISTPPSSCTGAQNSHSSWEVCRGLHMICGHHSKPHPIGWRLRQWRSVVSDHTDCHQQTRCPRICC